MTTSSFTLTAALAALCLTVAGAPAAPLVLHVAPGGDDAASGLGNNPLATLTGGRDAIRKLKDAGGLPAGGVVVELAGGVYEMQAPFELEGQDSGTADAPIEYRATPKAEVRLVGGKVLTGWQPVTDPAILDRLEPEARGKVLQCDLKALGVTDLGEIQPGPTWAQSAPGLELFFQDTPMTLARYPNDGFMKIGTLHGPTPQDIRGTKGCMEGIFEYDGDRPSRWVGEQQVMLEGYWFWDWADQRLRVKSIDTEQRIITLDEQPQHTFGFRKNQWFYAYNLLSEIDQPGEWYLDRQTGLMYFYPPADITRGKPMVSVTPTLVTMKDLQHVTLRGFTLEAVRGTVVTSSNAVDVKLAGCTIRNTGSWAARFSGGKHSGLSGCDLYQLGDGGVYLESGDRKTLTPGGLYVDDCHIYKFSRWNPVYKPAVMIQGVGQRISHNLIHDGPHMAIGFGGNDHVIELNEIHSVVYGSNDAGVMYCGYNPTMRGNEIRYNYIHHVYGHESRGCVGVYLDDMFCSANIHGNIFYQVPRAAFIGGGRDSTIENNVFVECNPSVHIDSRALGWAAHGVKTLVERLHQMPFDQEPWRSRFPQLLTYEQDEPAIPKGNVVTRNICWNGRWDEIASNIRQYVKVEDNLLDQDPKFVDPEHLNFQLQDDSPAFKLGFKRIPVDQIGLYQSPDRATWPVHSEVRPKPEAPPRPAQARQGGTVTYPLPKATAKVTVDGVLNASEWFGLKPDQGVVIEQGLQGEKVGPASRAWLANAGDALLVAFDNPTSDKAPIKLTNIWGQDDAVEIALRNPAAGANAPIIILRGYPTGKFESSNEAGATTAVVKLATEGVQYAAKVTAPNHWVCEWRIPWSSLGLDATKPHSLQFNLSVRKPAEDAWLMWQCPYGSTWMVDKAGVLAITP